MKRILTLFVLMVFLLAAVAFIGNYMDKQAAQEKAKS